jgi:hypothetical protein
MTFNVAAEAHGRVVGARSSLECLRSSRFNNPTIGVTRIGGGAPRKAAVHKRQVLADTCGSTGPKDVLKSSR